MNEEEKNYWVDFKAKVRTSLTQPQFKLLCKLHSKYYNHKYYEPCSCRPSEIKMWIADMDKIYNQSE